MKCFYCNRDGEWLDALENKYYCKEHATEVMNKYIEESDQPDVNTLKDWFIKVVEDDPNLIDVTLNTSTGEVTNADNNRQ